MLVDNFGTPEKINFGTLGETNLVASERDQGREERLGVGMVRGKGAGSNKARPVGRPRVDPAIEARIIELRRAGLGIHNIAKRLGVGTSAIQRVDAELRRERAREVYAEFGLAVPDQPSRKG